MPHPHGQIYSFPFIPPRMQKRARRRSRSPAPARELPYCDILKKERRDGRRIIAENEFFTVFIPFYARWPFEVHIFSRRHLGTLEAFRPSEERGLAEILKWLTLKYDNLYQMSFPYMMLLHQAPTRGNGFLISISISSFIHPTAARISSSTWPESRSERECS